MRQLYCMHSLQRLGAWQHDYLSGKNDDLVIGSLQGSFCSSYWPWQGAPFCSLRYVTVTLV